MVELRQGINSSLPVERQKELFLAFEVGVESSFAEAGRFRNLVYLCRLIADSGKDLLCGGQKPVVSHGCSFLRLAGFGGSHMYQNNRNRLTGIFTVVKTD
jgi:hypothetical protein